MLRTLYNIQVSNLPTRCAKNSQNGVARAAETKRRVMLIPDLRRQKKPAEQTIAIAVNAGTRQLERITGQQSIICDASNSVRQFHMAHR
jgi:hypothetical protein